MNGYIEQKYLNVPASSDSLTKKHLIIASIFVAGAAGIAAFTALIFVFYSFRIYFVIGAAVSFLVCLAVVTRENRVRKIKKAVAAGELKIAALAKIVGLSKQYDCLKLLYTMIKLNELQHYGVENGEYLKAEPDEKPAAEGAEAES